MCVALADLLRDFRQHSQITHCLLVLDHPEPSFRSQIYAPYKAHRNPMPDDLASQMPDLPAVAAALGIPVIQKSGYEADDVMVTMAERAAHHGFAVRICTRDKDIDQVLDKDIQTWDPIKGQLRGPGHLMRERGILPEQVVDYLVMIGDTADNIPGIPGVGPKRAQQYLQKYGTLDQLLANGDQITGKTGENIRQSHETVERGLQLVAIPRILNLVVQLNCASSKNPAMKRGVSHKTWPQLPALASPTFQKKHRSLSRRHNIPTNVHR